MGLNNMSFGDLLEHIRNRDGLPSQDYTKNDYSYLEKLKPVYTKRDYWQEGLNDEYQRAVDLQDLINLGKQ